MSIHKGQIETILPALALCLQVAALLAGDDAGAILTAAAWLAAPALTIVLLVGGSARPGGRRVLVPLLLLQAVLLGTGIRELQLHRESPEDWISARQADLTTRLRGIQTAVPALRDGVDALRERSAEMRSGDDDFSLLAELRGSWQPAGGVDFPLSLAYWRDGERQAWSGDLVPFPLTDLSTVTDTPAVVKAARSWRWRGGWPWRDGRLEWQVKLADSDPRVRRFDGLAAGPPATTSEQRTVVYAHEPRRGDWVGSPAQGLRTSVDVALASSGADEPSPFLRLSVRTPPRTVLQQRQDHRLDLLRLLLTGGALLVVVSRHRSVAWSLAGVWTARAFLVSGGLSHLLGSAFAIGGESAAPDSLASLIDPAYFASTLGWGLFGSTLDALLTVVALAVSLRLLSRTVHPSAGPRFVGRGDVPRALFLGLCGALLLLGLYMLARECVLNANPRLIGPRIPLSAWTFWGLHLTLLIAGGAALGGIAMLAVGLDLRRRPVSALLVLAGALAPLSLVRGFLPPAQIALLPAVVLLIWWGTALLPSPDLLLRRLGRLLPLLLAIVWTYLSLSGNYEIVRRDWLLQRAAEVAESREEWIGFLLEDLLTDIAGLDAELALPPDAHARDAIALWRDWRAFEMWRLGGLDDMRLSGELELIDAQGETAGLYASGFFRDYGYELVARGDWETGSRVMPRVGLERTIHMQREQRRFADGDEWVLRGEIRRIESEGWISLTLPIASGRISTLSERFQRDAAATRGGYVPRADLDRPLIILRGDDTGWLDAGGADLPDRAASAVIGSLRAGAAEHGRVRIGDADYFCVWRDAGPQASTPGEGFLLGISSESPAEKLLDLSRLVLLDLLLLLAMGGGWFLLRRLAGGANDGGGRLGLQERLLFVFLIVSLLPLGLSGMFIDRLSREWLGEDARIKTAEGLSTAREQLQGLLAEQARALAGSDYIAELLESRLAGRRPMGPYSARQAMVFTADGQLLLDETLSDLDAAEADRLLSVARRDALVLMQDNAGLYLGTLIPVDLTGLPETSAAGDPQPPSGSQTRRSREGHFFYRQRLDANLVAGLSEVIQGEAALHVAGEVLLASHPGNVFSGRTPLLMPPAVARQLDLNPGNTLLQPSLGTDLAWTGMLTLPLLANDPAGGGLIERNPAALSVVFPARDRDYARQRARTVLFLAGLATLIFLSATLLGLALTWKIFDPVRVLVGATRRLAAGDFDAPIPEAGNDELGALSASFRGMRDDLRRAQLTLAESERFLSSVLETVPVGVAVLDTERRPVVVNPAARRMADVLFGEGAGAPDDRLQLLLAGFERAVGGDEGPAELVSPDGARTLRGRLAPLHLPDGRSHALIVCEDVSEFLRTKKLAINAQMARQVAHEVKNPLTPIQLSIQFLQQAWRDKAEDMDGIVEATVRQVLEQVELLRSIATEFSLLGRPEDPVCGETDFAALVREVVDRYRDGGSTVRMAERDLPPVLAHADSLAKVIANLMENSLQAAGKDVRIEIDWIRGEGELSLIWRDDGPGLSDEVADRLFDPYFSTKTQGTGLGLPICRSLLAGMGGRIDLRNRGDGAGAEAEVTLPLHAPTDGKETS